MHKAALSLLWDYSGANHILMELRTVFKFLFILVQEFQILGKFLSAMTWGNLQVLCGWVQWWDVESSCTGFRPHCTHMKSLEFGLFNGKVHYKNIIYTFVCMHTCKVCISPCESEALVPCKALCLAFVIYEDSFVFWALKTKINHQDSWTMPCSSASTFKTKQKPGGAPGKPRAGCSIPWKGESSVGSSPSGASGALPQVSGAVLPAQGTRGAFPVNMTSPSELLPENLEYGNLHFSILNCFLMFFW